MSKSRLITNTDVELFEQVRSHLDALASEIGLLAKKSADAPLNKFKVQIVNERLRVANRILMGAHKPFNDFLEFDESALPSASDVVVVLSQYLSSLEGWRSANVIKHSYSWFWNTKELDLRAAMPTRAQTEAE